MSLADFARQLGWSKATVHRYLSALHRGGLLSYDEDRLIYSIGPEIVRLSSILLRSNSLSDLAAPIIRELAQETGLTATLSVWLDTWPVVVRCESSPSRLGHWELPVGSPIPPPSAAGQIYAAFDESGQGRYHQGVAADIAAVRAAGVAFQDNLHDGVRAAAVPIATRHTCWPRCR